jgi:hypothetical protein
MGAGKVDGGQRWIGCLAAAGVGLCLLGEYAGVLPWRPSARSGKRAIFGDPYHWQVAAIGLAFFLAGVSFVVPPKWPLLGRALGISIVVSLAAGIIGSFAAR